MSARRGRLLPLPPALALTLALTLAAPTARAQFNATDNNSPISIQSDSGIEWQQNTQLYIARGNAVASRGNSEIHGDTLIAHYRKAKGPNASGDTEIYRIEAEGNVTIKRVDRVVVGDRADYDVDQAVGIVRGKALKMTSPADTVTARDSFEWYDNKQIAVARGDAVAVHNGRTIKGDVLTAYMVKTPPAGTPAQPAKPAATQPAAPGAKPGAPGAPSNEESKINRIDVQGHVVITGAEDIGRGDYAVYNAATGICTLLGNVVITRGKDIISGQYAVMDLNKNVSRILPASTLPGSTRQRVQGMFVREQTPPGQTNPSKPAPPPAPPGKTP